MTAGRDSGAGRTGGVHDDRNSSRDLRRVPDARVEVVRTLVDGSTAAVEAVFDGTHAGTPCLLLLLQYLSDTQRTHVFADERAVR